MGRRRRSPAGWSSLASGGDGGGSIRIPAGYTGLLGFKGTFGRIPRGPHAYSRPNTVVLGNLARSVRDAARYQDVCGGPHGEDPTALPKHPGFEAGLGTHDLRGKRVAVVPALGGVTLDPGVEDKLRADAAELIASTGMVQVDVDLTPPNLTAQWMMGNTSTLLADLDRRWPGCAGDLTEEVAIGLRLSSSLYNLHTAAVAERLRVEANEAMARAFEQVDFVIAATNPGPAFPADATTSNPTDSFLEWAQTSQVAAYAFRGVLGAVRVISAFAPRLPSALLGQASERFPDLVNMGALTIISNVYGNPAVSIPSGTLARPAGRHAGPRPPPRGRAAVRRRPRRRARAPLAAGRPRQDRRRRLTQPTSRNQPSRTGQVRSCNVGQRLSEGEPVLRFQGRAPCETRDFCEGAPHAGHHRRGHPVG